MRGRRSEFETALLRLLGQSVCPICHGSADHDRKYFFWFLNENYFEPSTIDGLARSLGFCLAHGDTLVETLMGGDQLRYVHQLLIQQVRGALGEHRGAHRHRRGRTIPPTPLRPTGPCPACQSRWEAEDRNLSALAGLLQYPEGLDQYGRPGLLCFGHLQRVAPRLPDGVFLHVLRVHETAMRAALGAPGRAREKDQALALCAGHDIAPDPYPPPQEYRAPVGLWDPVAEFLDALRGDACAICLEQRRAWLEWTAWLEAAADRGEGADDLLPTCPAHVWPLVHHGSTALADAVTRHALGAALAEVEIALPRRPPPPRHLLERIDERLWGPRRRLRAAREVMARDRRCPLCSRMAVALDRGVALLLAVLKDPHHRAALARGYGLCLKHFPPAFAAAPVDARDLLVEVEDGKLAVLHWELVEAGRKAAWHVRPERKGREAKAWRRAVHRFSGSLRLPAG